MEKSYEVFISCKSQDYVLGQAVYDFLISRNIKAFFAPVSLSKEGNAEYGSFIDETIDEVKHLIVVTSNPEYVKTQWVKHEWDLFLREKNSGRKNGGNLLTVLKGIEPASLHISLRNVQSIKFENIKKELINFLPLSKPSIQTVSTTIVPNIEKPKVQEQKNDTNSQNTQKPNIPKEKTQEKTVISIAPDDPCPCGSGRKFKECHGRGM